MSTRISGRERLDDLPSVFTSADLRRRMGWDAAVASVYITRWRARGWIELAGERTGVYYNRTLPSTDPSCNLADALKLIYPSTLVTGASALHAAGWSTQIPAELHVAVTSRPSLKQINGAVLHPASRRRFMLWQKASNQLGLKPLVAGSLPALHPAIALVDAWSSKLPGVWRPDPDDIDPGPRGYDQIKAAAMVMGVTPPIEWSACLDTADIQKVIAPSRRIVRP